ncbi:MAG: hypothetical protein KC656_19180 [Myxococcales bacterium]|nr:hypothetical protein [Myxococcales bacterium]MCB9672701.1 hypothetical protein [Alphaproteobacteria bacterium]
MSAEQQRAPLGFMTLWLTGWSVGVAVIQSLALQGELFLLLFLLTHGGAEVGILLFIANSLRKEMEEGATLPRLELAHDGMTARWSVGTGGRLRGLHAAALGLVAHLLCYSGVVLGVVDGGPFAWALGLVLAGVWAFTGLAWVRAVAAQLRGPTEVVLEADLDGVRLQRGDEVTTFPLESLEVRADQTHLRVAAGGTAVAVPCPDSRERREIVDMLGLMAGRQDDRVDVPVPDALARMRAVDA